VKGSRRRARSCPARRGRAARRGMIMGGRDSRTRSGQPKRDPNQDPSGSTRVRPAQDPGFIGGPLSLGRPALGHFVSIKSGNATTLLRQRLAGRGEDGSGPRPGSRPGQGNWLGRSIQLDIAAIMRSCRTGLPHLPPHRPDLSPRENRVVGIKHVTINEPFFVGHFPGIRSCPVLIIAAMAQLCGVLLLNSSTNGGEAGLFHRTTGPSSESPCGPGTSRDSSLTLLR